MASELTAAELARAKRWMDANGVVLRELQYFYLIENKPVWLLIDNVIRRNRKEDAVKELAIALRPIFASVGPVLFEEAAKVCESLKGGYTASFEENILVPDQDGPWVLNTDAAVAIRGLARAAEETTCPSE